MAPGIDIPRVVSSLDGKAAAIRFGDDTGDLIARDVRLFATSLVSISVLAV
jgi:hypothetical protein